ncbi:hypothetical protein [Cryobacterium sp.]|jgi:hypothetical protein|uniref:hypothetical protein n=1 Tax=Cryobacterium sp. TaxID=1926290 RepID=UPI00262C5E62|nr:hypothetical protein [Cryobacterium sp.]MCU1446139.1 hypothetical protein [Cryobacterium sp.]
MSSEGRARLGWGPSVVTAVLWLVCSATFGYLTWRDRLPRQILAHAVAEGMPAGVWNLPGPWVALVAVVSTVAVFLVHLLLADLVGRGSSGPRITLFFALWFAAVATAVLASAPFALSAIVTEFPPARAAFILDPAGSVMLQSGYWGLLWGWIPALLASRRPAVTVPAGGYAVTRIAWNAMPTDGELVAYTLYGALYPGLERGSWPATLDIIAGGDVSVTAWSVRDGGTHTD